MEIPHPVSILNILSSSSCNLILHRRNKFYPNWTITERVMTLCRFFKMAAIPKQIYFRFLVLWRLYQISQSTAEILLLMVTENKRPPYINSTPGFKELFTVIGMWFCTDLLNFVRKKDQQRSYDVILISQDGGYSVANLLPVRHVGRSKAISIAYEISTKYLNAYARYYYFRFLKKGRQIRHIHILVSVSIFTFSLSPACDSAVVYQILCKSDDRQQSYDVILILQDGGHSVANLLPVSGLATPNI